MNTYKVDNISELNSHEEMIVKECANNISQYKDSDFKWEDFNKFIFCEIDNKLCGVAIYWETEDSKTFLSKIYTYMKYRRCGVASRLIEEVENIGRDIILGIAPSNLGSIELFKNNGYENTMLFYSKDIKDVPR